VVVVVAADCPNHRRNPQQGLRRNCPKAVVVVACVDHP
jgi:hypothetical protein